jgi:diguanylate cyclase (GGDEF)-like protein/PAS domain S-box-containing protein
VGAQDEQINRIRSHVDALEQRIRSADPALLPQQEILELRAAIEELRRDVTEPQRAEQAARRLMQEQETILDTVAEGILGVDPRGTISFANSAATRILDLPTTSVLGRPLLELLHVDAEGSGTGRTALRTLVETLQHGHAGHGELDYKRGDGEVVPLEFLSTRIQDGELLGGMVVSFRDVGERRRLERELQHQADHDSLTDLLNRRAFERELGRELALTSRYRTPTAVMLLDVDGLKQVNDAFGHLAGDELLRNVGLVLRSRLRRTDSAARLGGDEFGVLLPRAGERAGRTVAEQILAVLARHHVAAGGRGGYVSISIGVALVRLGGLGVEDVFRAADGALYRAKEAGGGRIEVVKSVRK